MTPREIQLLVGIFEEFLGVAKGQRFLITNQSLDIMVQHFGEQLRWAKSQEALLQHLYDHAEEERNKLLNNPMLSSAVFEGVPTPVFNESAGTALKNSKPVNHHGF